MKFPVSVLVLAGILSVLAGADFAYGDDKLACGQSECQFKVTLKPFYEQTYEGICGPQNKAAENMVCHKAKGITCTKAEYIDKKWTCQCGNWTTKEHSTSIDVYCSD